MQWVQRENCVVKGKVKKNLKKGSKNNSLCCMGLAQQSPWLPVAQQGKATTSSPVTLAACGSARKGYY